MIVAASYLSPRPATHGDKANSYTIPVLLVEAACKRLGIQHVVITERDSELPPGLSFVYEVDGTKDMSLMKAILAGQADYLRTNGVANEGTIMIGADVLFCRDPREVFGGGDWDIGLSVGPYVPGGLSNGTVYLAPGRRPGMAHEFYKAALAVCGDEWGEDQEAIRRTALPLVKPGVIVERDGFKLRFLDQTTHDAPPHSAGDGALAKTSIAVHFKGNRKDFMAEWARLHLGIETPDDPRDKLAA